jgi:hypothetical protein
VNTTEYIARVRLAARIPDGDEDFTDTKILDSGSENLRERYAAVLQNRREGYWLHRESVSASATTNEYRIPARAIAQGLEKVEVSYTGLTWVKLNPMFDSDAGLYDSTSPGQPNWFSLEADYVRIYPMPDTSCTIRFSYALRPSRLRALSALGAVVSAPTSSTIRVSSDPTALIGASGTLDVVNTTGCNEVAIVALPFSAIASAGGGNYDITITGGASLTRIAAGQVVRPADQTDYIPLPVELHDSLVRRVAGMYLIEAGDSEQGNTLLAAAEASIKRFQETSPRVKGQPFKVKSGRSTYLRRRYG